MKRKPIETRNTHGRLLCAELHCIRPAACGGLCARHDPEERPATKRRFKKAMGASVRMDRLYFKREERGTASEKLRARWARAGHRYTTVALRAYYAGRL